MKKSEKQLKGVTLLFTKAPTKCCTPSSPRSLCLRSRVTSVYVRKWRCKRNREGYSPYYFRKHELDVKSLWDRSHCSSGPLRSESTWQSEATNKKKRNIQKDLPYYLRRHELNVVSLHYRFHCAPATAYWVSKREMKMQTKVRKTNKNHIVVFESMTQMFGPFTADFIVTQVQYG
jgi:hypothetical protein